MVDIPDALTFDDVLLVPARSDMLPSDAETTTRLTRTVNLGIPLISAAMDTVTESGLAIAMAQAGGLGVIHKNLEPEQQAEEVRRVKKYESGMVINPLTLDADSTLSDALGLQQQHGYSGFPVVETDTGQLVGILTNRDVRFAENPDQRVSELMTAHSSGTPLVTVKKHITREEAKKLLHKHRLERLLVVDDDFRSIGLITVTDIEKEQQHPNACKDENGQLRVAAATGVGEIGFRRAELLLDAGADIIVVDTAHGHSSGVISAISQIKKLSNRAQVVGGNIATANAARALIDAGADCVKVGIGPGTICTTRMVAGVGMPQLTAIMDVSEVCRKAFMTHFHQSYFSKNLKRLNFRFHRILFET